MNKVILAMAVFALVLPSFAQDASREKMAQYEAVEAIDLNVLENLYDLAVIRASNLSCFSKKPDIFDRIRRNKRYKRHKLRRKNSDLCNIEYLRIELAADNLDTFNDIKLRRSDAGNKLFNKVALTRHAIISDINERKERMRDLACHMRGNNADICDSEEGAIEYIKVNLLPVVNKQMKTLWGYDCPGTRSCN